MTSSPFLFLMAFLSGVCFYTGFNTLLLGWRGQSQRIHISFAIMSLLVGGFIIAQTFAYEAITSAELIQRRRLDLSLAILIFIAFTWFITFYTAWTYRRVTWGLTSAFVILLLLNWLFPYGLLYPVAPVFQRFALPWGEVVTDIGTKVRSAWYYITWLILVTSFLFLFVACGRMYRQGARQRARILMVSAGVFLVFVLSNNLVNYRVVQFVYPAPFGFIALIVMMGLYLNLEHQRLNRLLHASEGRYAAIIASTVDGIIITDQHQRIWEFNAAAEHLFGYRAAELIGKPIDCLFAEGPRWGYQQQLREIAADRANLPALQRFGRINGLRADGREFPVDASFSQVTLHGQQFVSAIVRDASESQKDKEAVRVSAERYRALVGNIPGMVYRAAPVSPWRMQFVSDGVQLISGQAASDYLGERAAHWLEQIVPEDRAAVADAYTRLVTLRNPEEFTYRIRHRDNSIRWVLDRAQLVSNARGQPLWIDGLALDITRQKEAEQAVATAFSRLEGQVQERTRELSRIIDRFNEAQRVANLGSWELDLVTNKLEWSDEIFRIFAIDKNQFGASYEAFLHAIHPDDRDKVNRAYTDAVASQRPYDIKHRLLLPNEQIKYVHERAVTEYDPEGKALRSAGTVQDITGLVLIENQLRETTGLLNSIIDNLPNMIFLKHAENLRFVLLNKAGEELTGLSREELLGKNDYDFFPKAQADFFTSQDRIVLDQVGVVDIPEEPLDTLRQGRRILHTKKIALRDAQGVPRYLLGISADITTRIETEKQLRIKDAAINYSLNAIAIADLSGALIYVNPAFCTMWGVTTPQDILGQPATVFSIGPPPVAAIIAVLLERGQWQGELPALDLRGNKFHLEISATVIRDAEGRPTHMAASFLDISARVAAMQALAQHDQELQQLNAVLEQRVVARTRELEEARQFNAAVVDTVGALVVVLERSGQIILFNHACELTTGYGTAEVLGKCLWDFLLIAQEREPVKQMFSKLTAGDFPSAYENYWLHRDGALRRIAWSNTAITDAAGKVEYVIGTGMDITQRREAEIALRNSEELFRQLAENINKVFFVRDLATGQMIYVSPAYETLWQRSSQELFRDPMAFFACVHPDDMDKVRTAHQRQRDASVYFNEEYRIVREDGEVRWMWARTFPVFDETGSPYRLAGLVEDITERRMAEETRLAQARAQRDLLVREVHHRIKNNLQGIIGLLRRHVTTQPELKPAVDSAITQVNAMALVHGLQGKAVSERIKLCELTEAIAASIAGLTGMSIQPLVEWVTIRPVLVAADEAVPIALIVNELLFNAAKHSLAGSPEPIHVTIDCLDQVICLTIRSQGKALPADFDLQQGQGIGTGLLLVKALLPQHCQIEICDTGGFIQTTLKLAPPAVVTAVECTELL